MSRKPQLHVDGAFYHVVLRGNHRPIPASLITRRTGDSKYCNTVRLPSTAARCLAVDP